MNAIEVKDLNTWYGKFHALKNVSFVVPEGKVAGLLGPNGAGKTTLIKSILSLLPHEGEIKFFGENPDRKEIGYVSENEGYYEWMRGEEYLQYFADMYGVERKRVEEMLKVVGLEDRRNTKIKEFSNGMRRRLSIARALLHDPKIVIMDEPLSGLDPLIKKEITELIRSVTGEKTFIISSHQLRDIEGICDWLILIKDGEIINFGEPEKIIGEIKPTREIAFTIRDEDIDKIDALKFLAGVRGIDIRKNMVIVKFEGDDDSIIFEYLTKNKIKFSLKMDSLDSIYREVFQ